MTEIIVPLLTYGVPLVIGIIAYWWSGKLKKRLDEERRQFKKILFLKPDEQMEEIKDQLRS